MQELSCRRWISIRIGQMTYLLWINAARGLITVGQVRMAAHQLVRAKTLMLIYRGFSNVLPCVKNSIWNGLTIMMSPRDRNQSR